MRSYELRTSQKWILTGKNGLISPIVLESGSGESFEDPFSVRLFPDAPQFTANARF